MNITSDWHIHSRNSCDEAALAMADLLAAAPRLGIRDFGVTDHLHTPYNLPDIANSRSEFDSVAPGPRFHFGIEVSCVSAWELDEVARGRHDRPVYGVRAGGPRGAPLAIGLEREDIGRFGIEFVVGGAHWPMYVPFEREAIIRDYHRQNMFLAQHPLVDIVAHPWWWMGDGQDAAGNYPDEPWLGDFARIPRSMHDEFAAACREGGTKAEINLGAILLSPRYPESFRRQYAEYLAELKGKGVRLSIGSDCHDAQYAPDFAGASARLDAVGISESDCWAIGKEAP